MKKLLVPMASLALLLGCPPADRSKKAPAAAASCTSVGQSCEFSPGKLGTCVSKEPCVDANCLVCQSQH